MVADALKILFHRDLNKLKTEIESYQKEEMLWHFDKNISNSAGNLCLHLIGNLNAYIGAGLAKSGYVRNRELEFSQRNIPKTELIQKIEATLAVVEKGLDMITEQQMNADFPIVIWDKSTGMAFTLIHLSAHLNYHLGQINYHRRLLDNI